MLRFFKKKQKPENCLVALSADKLLAPYQNLIKQIHQQVGVPESHWQAVYFKFIQNFAEQVQLLPASESHHHANLGGLLSHSLEVGLHALKFRKSKMLPLGAAVDVIEQQKERWSYAIFTAAVLHDIGKIHTDQRISILENSTKTIWTPLTSTLPKGCFYQIDFNHQRQYHQHETISLLFAAKLLPDTGLNWIASNPQILNDWTHYLSGQKQSPSVLAELVTQADQVSTAKSLTGSEKITLPSSQIIPLHQRLLTSLIYLLDNNELPLNRAGAAAWVFDEKLWLVSKRVLDKIRSQMTEEGQSGIPSDNTRLMDELMQHGIITPTDTERAIWKITVQIEDWSKDLTCLCLPLNQLWADSQAWPAQLDSIKISEVKNKKAETSKVQQKQTKETPKTLVTQFNNLPLPPMPSSNPEPVKENKQNNPKADKPKLPTKNTGKDFINWISKGIADGSLPVNIQNALIHTIGENKDLILVSPLIFRKYANLNNTTYQQVQHDFQSLKLHKITKTNKNVWKFETISKRNNKKGNRLNGMLIERAEEKMGIRLPPANMHLKAVE